MFDAAGVICYMFEIRTGQLDGVSRPFHVDPSMMHFTQFVFVSPPLPLPFGIDCVNVKASRFWFYWIMEQPDLPVIALIVV